MLCFSLGLAAALSARAADSGTVELITDLLETFPAARVEHTSDCNVRRPGSAGGVRQDALFEHPYAGPNPARATYDLALPSVGVDGLLLLAFDVAISDGVRLGQVEDGVRFVVEVNRELLFSTQARKTEWQSHAVDLTPYAGQRVALALCTDAVGNSSYDWALWGSPRLLLLQAQNQLPDTPPLAGPVSTPLRRAIVIVQGRPGTKIRVRPSGGGDALEWVLSENQARSNAVVWLAREFDFPAAQAVAIDWEPKDALAHLRWATFVPKLRLVQITAGQAIVTAGSTVPLLVEAKNEGRGELAAGEAKMWVKVDGNIIAGTNLPSLHPAATWQGRWDWSVPAGVDKCILQAELSSSQGTTNLSQSCEVFASDAPSESIGNEKIKLVFVRHGDGFAFARVYARQPQGWQPVAVWSPLFRIVSRTSSGPVDWPVRPADYQRRPGPGPATSADIQGSVRDPDGIEWQVRLSVALEPNQPKARLEYAWRAALPRQVHAVWGPNVYVGDETVGAAKTWGLFPGLEYLFGAEPSSNPRDFAPHLADRRTPHPHKVTVPLMAVTVGPGSQTPPENPARFYSPDSLKDWPSLASRSEEKGSPTQAIRSSLSPRREGRGSGKATVALWWDPLQRWDGEHTFPAARFASPNFDQAMANHRLGLFLPGCPEFVPENSTEASTPLLLPADRTWKLSATLAALPGPATAALGEWVRETGGLPKPNPWPRSFQAALDVCRTGFLETVWDAPTEKWRHCIGWAPSHAPGYAALLWLDARLADGAEKRKRSSDRVDLVARRMLQEAGPGLFTSQSGCHIMQWEFPFYYGYLPESLIGVEGLVRQFIQSQAADGGWRYQPANAEQASLGQAGDAVLGTCANRAASLLRYARITGDSQAWAAGEKALGFMEQFRVPRGGQTWECPMYEPDVLAAAYAIRAYHDAYRISGDPRWLQNAIYWAETGVSFVYLWSLPDKPMMLGATIPVFGSTFYTHSWLAVPVQWCGLVYAYHVFQLAEELEHTAMTPPATNLPHTLALGFSPADWRRLVELITVSGLYQQFPDGDKAGAYPDSISQFEKRNPAFINPEDILVNVLALHGHNPDIKTARLRTDAGQYLVSSGAEIQALRKTDTALEFQLRFYPGDRSHTLVVGARPKEVRVDGNLLSQAEQPVRQDPGWWWDAQRTRLYLVAPHAQETARLTVHIR